MEVYGRKKQRVAYNYHGQRAGRPHVAIWTETETPLAADLGGGPDDPRATRTDLLARALAGLPRPDPAASRSRLRADAGYFAGRLARAAHAAGIGFAIGAKRIAPLWRLLDGIDETVWADAKDMHDTQVAVTDYRPADWPEATRLLIRRVRLTPSRSPPTPAHGAAAPCTPTSAPCRSTRSPTRSTATASSPPTSTSPPPNGRSRSSTGTCTAPPSRTSSATAKTVPPSVWPASPFRRSRRVAPRCPLAV